MPLRSMPLVLLAAAALAAADPSPAAQRRAFVTSVAGTGNLASWSDAGGEVGLAAGDEICRNRAAAGGLANAGAYRAWLSTASTDAYCHVQGLTGKRGACAGGPPLAAGPWYRVPDPLFPLLATPPIAESLDALVAPTGAIYRPVLRDEFGESVAGDSPVAVWTGTDDEGAVASDATCAGWVSAAGGHLGLMGDPTATAQIWTSHSAQNCNAELRLLCLEPGASEPSGQRWSAPGSIVFLTSAVGQGDLGSWLEAADENGLAAGDAICRNLAAAAHLPAPESFVAWISTGAVDATDRLTSNGPFRRIDGVTVAVSKADLLDGSNSGSIHQHETGAYQIGGASGQARTATLADGTADVDTCSDWTSGAAQDVLGGLGGTTLGEAWTANGLTSCQYLQHLYCFSNAITLFWDGFDATGDLERWSASTP